MTAGAIRGTSSEKAFSRIRIRILKIETLVKKIMFILQNFHEKRPLYLLQLIPPNNNIYATRSSQSSKISSFKIRHIFSKIPFFLSNI